MGRNGTSGVHDRCSSQDINLNDCHLLNRCCCDKHELDDSNSTESDSQRTYVQTDRRSAGSSASATSDPSTEKRTKESEEATTTNDICLLEYF